LLYIRVVPGAPQDSASGNWGTADADCSGYVARSVLCEVWHTPGLSLLAEPFRVRQPGLSPRRLPADTTRMEWQLVLVLALVLVALGNYLDIASEDGELVKSKGTRRSQRSRD